MPFLMLRPDPLLQSLVDKLFPEAVEKDYEQEEVFYSKRGMSLPDHLIERKKLIDSDRKKVEESLSELDNSVASAPPHSDIGSELQSEPISVNVSISLPDTVATESSSSLVELPPVDASSFHPNETSHEKNESPRDSPDTSSKMDLG